MDEYTMTTRDFRHLFENGDQAGAADYHFVTFLLGDLSRQLVARQLIVVPGLNGVETDDIVRALDTIYKVLDRQCIGGSA